MLRILILITICNFTYAQPFTDLLKDNLINLKDNPLVNEGNIKCTEAYINTDGESFKVSEEEIKKVSFLSQNDSKAYNRRYFHYNRVAQDIYAGNYYYFYSRQGLLNMAIYPDYPSGVGFYMANDPYSSSSFGNVVTYTTLKKDQLILNAFEHYQVINKYKHSLAKKENGINSCSMIYFIYLFAKANDIHIVKYNNNWYYMTLSKVIESQESQVLNSIQTDRKKEISKKIFGEGSHLHYKNVLSNKFLLCDQLNQMDFEENKLEKISKELECKN